MLTFYFICSLLRSRVSTQEPPALPSVCPRHSGAAAPSTLRPRRGTLRPRTCTSWPPISSPTLRCSTITCNRMDRQAYSHLWIMTFFYLFMNRYSNSDFHPCITDWLWTAQPKRLHSTEVTDKQVWLQQLQLGRQLTPPSCPVWCSKGWINRFFSSPEVSRFSLFNGAPSPLCTVILIPQYRPRSTGGAVIRELSTVKRQLRRVYGEMS